MVNISLTKKELLVYRTLVHENKNSAKLQKITNMGYSESIKLINKLTKKIEKDVGWSYEQDYFDGKV